MAMGQFGREGERNMTQTDASLSEAVAETELIRIRRNELAVGTEVDRRTRIVCIGGGTGLPVVLKGLVKRTAPRLGDPGLDLTAIVAMADDGGSSGKLRRTRGLLPPGDIRNCLVALAGGENELSELFQYRFGGRKDLGGHAVGNLLIAALTELKGDFLEAVRLSGKLLDAKGTVLPSTVSPVQLVGHMDDGSVVVGEQSIVKSGRRIAQVSLHPRSPPPSRGTIEAIRAAELITIGPGSLYSSVLPNLLVDGVADALKETRALKVMVANLMTQPGETDGMSCLDHVKAIIDHVGPVLDAVLVNVSKPAPELLSHYSARGSLPVAYDRRALIETGVIPIEADLLKAGKRIRHDPNKVARCLLKLARSGL